MTAPGAPQITAELAALVAQGRLPRKARAVAEQMAARLSAPPRVALLGLPGAGQVALANALVGAPLLPREGPRATAELRYGARDEITATFGDGRVAPVESFAEGAEAAFLGVTAPEPRLQGFSLLVVETDGTPAEMAAAGHWAAARADVVLWLSAGLPPDERAIWEGLREALAGQALLVWTAVPAAPAALAPEGFYAQFVVDLDAGDIAALDAGLARRLDQGRQADLDGAQLFLRRYSAAPVSRPLSRPVSRPVSQPVSRPVSIAAPPRPPAADPTAAALALIAGLAARMPACATTADALELCAGVLAEMQAALEGSGLVEEALIRAEDLMVLLQLERTEQAAVDAALVMLQLKRDLEAGGGTAGAGAAQSLQF